MLRMRSLFLAVAARVPGLNGWIVNRGTGGSNKAEYCYGVWMKHMAFLHRAGMERIPDTIAELGPGDSFGVGLCALLCGASRYFALDVRPFANMERNLEVLEDLIALFQRRTGRPTRGWPSFDHLLDEGLFPSQQLQAPSLARLLSRERVQAIRDALANGRSKCGRIEVRSVVPWMSSEDLSRESVGLIFSHSVLEHVRDLSTTYRAFSDWLEPSGWLSHQIDFTSHGLTSPWNGHWAIGSNALWEFVSERRDCWINRQPWSFHRSLIGGAGFRFVDVMCNHREDGIRKSELATPWQGLESRDVTCQSVYFIARKS
jgi:hypothetical protein